MNPDLMTSAASQITPKLINPIKKIAKVRGSNLAAATRAEVICMANLQNDLSSEK